MRRIYTVWRILLMLIFYSSTSNSNSQLNHKCCLYGRNLFKNQSISIQHWFCNKKFINYVHNWKGYSGILPNSEKKWKHVDLSGYVDDGNDIDGIRSLNQCFNLRINCHRNFQHYDKYKASNEWLQAKKWCI